MAGGITPNLTAPPSLGVAASQREPALVRRVLIGVAVSFLSIFVLLPVVNVFAQAFAKGAGAYVAVFHAPARKDDESARPRVERRALAKERTQVDKTWNAIKMTLGIAAVAVPLNCVFGLAASWLIAKFRFRGRALLTSLIDLPFSVSPVVAGLIFVLLFGRQGWFGHWALDFRWSCPGLTWRGFGEYIWPVGVSWTDYQGIIFTPLAMVLATVFVTFPFVARNLIPLMEAQGSDDELAAMTLGAGRWQTFWRVTLPNIRWGLLYGVILCNARAMGEFGAVSVVAGHLDYNNTIPLRVEQLWLEPGNNQAAFAVASVLTVLAVVTLILKTLLEYKTRGEANSV